MVLAIALFTLLRREGVRGQGLFAVALVVLNPWFLIAATSTADYLFALAFVLLAALAMRKDRPVAAGVFAASVDGLPHRFRLLIVAILLAELFEGRPARRRVVITAAVTVVGTLLLFVPAFVASGSSLKFAENDFSTSSPLVQAGRDAREGHAPARPDRLALARWPRCPRCSGRSASGASAGSSASPCRASSCPRSCSCGSRGRCRTSCRVCCAWRSCWRSRSTGGPHCCTRWSSCQVLYIGLRIDVIKPDDPNKATGGRVAVDAGWGPVVVDLRCRHEQPKAYLGRQKVEIERAWNCAKPFGG